MLHLEEIEPFRLHGRGSGGGALFRQHQAVSGVGAPGRRLLPAGRQTFQSVFADRIQHHEARFPFSALDALQQALVHQRSHAVQPIHLQIALGVAHGFHRLQSAAAHKNRKSAEEHLFAHTQQTIAPVDCAAQSLLPGGQVPRPAGQQLQAALQAGLHGGRREQLDAGRGQFDGERQAVQAGTNGRHRRRIFLVHLKIGLDRPGALDEQSHRWITGQHLDVRNGFQIR